MDPLVTLEDLEGWLGQSLNASEAARAEAVLRAVSSLVRSEAGRTWEDEDTPGDVSAVVLEMSAGIYRNPMGVRQTSVGDASVTYAVVAGLEFTPSQRSILGRYRANQRGLWTMGTTRNDFEGDTVFVPVVDAPPFPWYAGDVEVN
jgi:hypothetical protein